MEASAFIAALAGRWTFTRSVTLGIEMRGSATFAAMPDHRLAYLEEGEILGTRMEFNRRYDYVFQGSDLAIYFADGESSGQRFLYFENLIAGAFPFSGKAEHLCGRDHYAADFTFSSSANFFTHYDIFDPEKAHGITTAYSKS